MSLKDIHIDKEYRGLKSDVVNNFYIPLLSNAIVYKRAVGFFNSSALYEIAIGLKHLVAKKGKMELIVSPNLSEEDIKSINLGYKKREEVIEKALLRDFDTLNTDNERSKLNLLANLIADSILDIKVAFKITKTIAGIYHEKIGIVIDNDNNKVAFSGSMNETYAAFRGNYEATDVFCSWRSEDADRVIMKERAFDNLWDNADNDMDVIPFPKVALERLNSYRSTKDTELLLKDESLFIDSNKKKRFFTIPENVKLFDYQDKAIKAWLENGSCGIFDMATGTGKTFKASTSG